MTSCTPHDGDEQAEHPSGGIGDGHYDDDAPHTTGRGSHKASAERFGEEEQYFLH